MTGLLDALKACGDRPGVLVSIVTADGSTPRGTGTTMIVDAGGRIAAGTIGGGALEHRAVARAAAMLAGGEAAGEAGAEESFPLGPELGQCCGGRVSLLFEHLPMQVNLGDGVAFVTALEPAVERRLVDTDALQAVLGATPFAPDTAVVVRGPDGRRVLVQPARDPGRPLWLFGAGHVGRAIVRAIQPLPFAVTWVDDRPGQFPDPCPAGVACRRAAAPEHEVERAPAGAFVLVMTHSHGLDYRVCRKALARGDLGYVGLIGSKTKLARFHKWGRAYGLGDAEFARLTCPIGLPGIGGKEPAVIAASVAADLLIRAEKAAVRAPLKVAS